MIQDPHQHCLVNGSHGICRYTTWDKDTFEPLLMLRKLRKLLLAAAVLCVVFISALVLIGNLYEEEVKGRLVGAINEQLNSPVSVKEMDLTLIARFPRASMRMSDVLAMEVRSDAVTPDTLLFAKELFLEFSLWDLFRGNYTIEQIHASQVKLYPGMDGNGKENYIIWKADSTSTTSSAIALDKVSFDDLSLRYQDPRHGVVIRSHHNNLSLKGRFAETLNEITLNGDAELQSWMHGGSLMIDDRKAHLRLEMAFNNRDQSFHITKGEVNIGKVPIDLTLDLTQGETGQELDLRANGLGLSLADVMQLLPSRFTKGMGNYGMQGDVDLALRYNGPIDGEGPALSVGAKLSRGKVKEKRSNTTFSDIYGELALELTPKGTPKKLVVQNFSAKSGSGSVSGNWNSTGLTNASLKADMKGDIALADIFRFAQVDTLEHVHGRLRADAQVEGRLRDVADFKAQDLKALKITGTAALRDASLKLKGARHRVTHLDVDMALLGNDAAIHGLKGEFHGNPIKLNGRLNNLIPYLIFDDQHLVIQAQGSSPRIDMAALLRSDNATAEAPQDYILTLPATIELDLTARVEELVFEAFSATAINGTIHMKDRVLRVSPMSFKTASGEVAGNLELDTRAKGKNASYPLVINATVQDIEMTQLFKEFQDFGQDFIGHRHLSGKTQATVAFNAPLSPDLKLDMDRLVCIVDVAIENGGIKGHKPLIDVADYLQSNKLISPFVNTRELRTRLADIRFSRLENQIQIRNGAVHIPSMEVKSTAMDIEISGTHWFDDRIDHHVNFRLGDLFRMGKMTDNEFGPVVDDGTGMRIFLHMYGNAYDPQFGTDGAMAAERRKQQFQQEKQELKSILREELGLFRNKSKDAPVVAEEKEKDQPRPKAVIVLEDPAPERAPATSKSDPPTPQETPKKGLGRLLNDRQEAPQQVIIIEE